MRAGNLASDLMHKGRFFTAVDAQCMLLQTHAALHKPMIDKIMY